MWGHFLLQGNSCVLLGNFCLSHIRKNSSSFLHYKAWTNGWRVQLIWLTPFLPYKAWTNGWRVPLVWFMPYNVERERSSFQCVTSKNCLGVHMSFLEAKNAPTLNITIFFFIAKLTFYLRIIPMQFMNLF